MSNLYRRAYMLLIITTLFACQPQSMLVDIGLITPTPTPDPFIRHRAILQPQFQGDIETPGPLPRYHITAQLNEAGTALNGVMQVVIPSSESELVFRLYPNTNNYNGSIEITRAQINSTPVETTALANNTAMHLNLPLEESPPSNSVTIDLAFITKLGNTPASKENYTLFGWDGSILSLPGFYPSLAVQQGGQWVVDSPPLHGDVLFSEVALYQLDITLPIDMVVVASGIVLNVIDNPNDTRTWQITGGPLRDMTVIAGPFQAISENAAGATVTAYYLPGHNVASKAVLAHATAALRLYSDLYGPYPYTELDVIEAPLNTYGMEYSNLVLIGTNLYENQPEALAFLVAHEVGHQWWYSMIGNNPYQHPWLDEGLTEYGAFNYYGTVFGPSQADQLLAQRWQNPLDARSDLNGRVDRPAADFDPLSYQLLVYGKTTLFFKALHQELGDEIYYKVIQTYYTENRYGLVTPQTFLATAERVSGQNLNLLVEAWLR